MYPFQCPHCSGMFQITPNFAGQAVACPHCSGGVLIPEMSLPAGPPQSFAVGPPPMTGMSAGFAPIPPQPPLPPPLVAPPLMPVPGPAPPPPTGVPSLTPPTLLPPSAAEELSPTSSANVAAATPERLFVIPTIDGGQAVIREPTRMAVSGTKRRQLRDLTPEQKSTRRMVKNLVVFGLCAVFLLILLWGLLTHGPI